MEQTHITAVVTGHTSGLGLAITRFLLGMGWEVHGWADGMALDPCPFEEVAQIGGGIFHHHMVDVRDRSDIEDAADGLASVDHLINCAGINHLCPVPDLQSHDWELLMDVNARALWLATQTLLPLLQQTAHREEGGTVLNIVSNAANVPMTHSLAYNASKAAALMVTRQMARELFKSHGVTIFSISPNKLRGTAMSRYIEESVPALRGWTPEEAEAYQLAALPIGEETEPNTLAEFIGFLLSTKERHRYLHGCNIPYGG